MGMTIVEKSLARLSGRAVVRPGDIVTVPVETTVLTDVIFMENLGWRWPRRLHNPDDVVLVADHIVMSTNQAEAAALRTLRDVARHYGISRVHDAGADQGICHQVVAENGYALPGSVLVNLDSHTLAVGGLNCLGRGLGIPEILQILCTGETWFRVGPTIRYELHGELGPGVTVKDLFLYVAGRWGAHEGMNVEFGGPAQAKISLDARRTLATMCAEISADFATWDPDDILVDFVRAKTDRAFVPISPDRDAKYVEVRRVDLNLIVPFLSGIDGVVHNTRPVSEVTERIRVDQCVVGSCANGTLDDIKVVASVLAGEKVAPGVRFFVTPGSQAVSREAAALGLLDVIAAAGALITPSACGACAALGFGALAEGEVCLTATTRNYKGRMGNAAARIYMASPATVAASAIAGYITEPTDQ